MRWPLAVLLATAACGDSDPEAPRCNAGEIGVSGIVGDTLHVVKASWKSYGFVNAFGGNGSFDADFMLDGDGKLHLEWPELVANGSRVEARGTLEAGNTTDALKVGNCLQGSDFSGTMTVDNDGEGGTFVLRGLRMPPYCGGAAVDGSLAGCFRNR